MNAAGRTARGAKERGEDIILRSLGDRARVYIARRAKPQAGGCWLWQRRITPSGYGEVTRALGGGVGRVRCRAHRLSYLAFVGPIADELCVCHRCDARACVNPRHLFVSTAQGNISDMVAKERQARGTKKASAKLGPAAVRAMFGLAAQRHTDAELADLFGVSKTTVRRTLTRENWGHIEVADNLVACVNQTRGWWLLP